MKSHPLAFVFIILLVSQFCHGAFAAGFTSLESAFYAPVNIKSPDSSAEEALKVSLSSVKLGWLSGKITHNNRFALQQDLSYRLRSVFYQDPLFAVEKNSQLSRLHSFHYRLIETFSVSNGWSLITTQQLGVHSDFTAFEYSDFRVEGGAILQRNFSAVNQLSFGAIYIALLGEPCVVPFVGYSDQLGTNKIDLALPFHASFSINSIAGATMGLFAQTYGNEYGIHQDSSLVNKVSYSSIVGGVFSRFSWDKITVFDFCVGWSMRNRLTSYLINGETQALELNNGLYIQLGMKYHW